jgi:uncharacterized protein
MRRLIDTNILLYAVNRDCPEHARAKSYLSAHLSSGEPWCLSWGVVYEFLRVATHPRVFPNPLSGKQAMAFLHPLLEHSAVTLLSETENHARLLEKTMGELSHCAGNLVHDLHTAVLLREHGVPEIVTADTDFLQFKFLQVSNPLMKGK